MLTVFEEVQKGQYQVTGAVEEVEKSQNKSKLSLWLFHICTCFSLECVGLYAIHKFQG